MQNMTNVLPASEEKIPVKEKLAYCFGDPALTIIYTLTTGLLVYFYTDTIGMPAGIVGTIMLISRLFDGFTDLAMGFIIDNTKSRFGKCRSWILRMIIPYGVTAVMLMTVPHSTVVVQAVYIFISYNLANSIVYTMIGMPFSTLGSLLTRNFHERTVISNIRMACSTVGSMIITALTLPLINAVGGDQRAWILVTSCYAVVACLMLLNTFRLTHERVQVNKPKTHVSVVAGLKALLHNKYFFICLLLNILFTVYQVLISTDLTYYCKYILGNDNLVSPISLAEKIPQIIAILILPFLIHRFSKRTLIVSGLTLGVIGQLIMLAGPESVSVLVAGSVFRGLGIAPYYGICFSMLADAVEYGDWKTHMRIEGLIFTASSFGQKFGSGITSAIIGFLQDLTGYDGMVAVQTESATALIHGMLLYVPIVVWILMIIIMLFWKLDKFYPKMMQELRGRET